LILLSKKIVFKWFQVSIAWFKGSPFKGSEVNKRHKKIDLISKSLGNQPTCDEFPATYLAPAFDMRPGRMQAVGGGVNPEPLNPEP
jgi:hypothetical protein